MTLTQEYLKQCLDYDPETGVFTWKMRPVDHFKGRRPYLAWNTRYANTAAGVVDGKGYLGICVCGRIYRAHRLAFLWMTGRWPVHEVDHVNHIRLDNRWVNLREATIKANRCNQKLSSASTCGITGVYYNRKRNMWVAQIKLNRKARYLGSFDRIEDAAQARKAEEVRLGFHRNHGTPLMEVAYAR